MHIKTRNFLKFTRLFILISLVVSLGSAKLTYVAAKAVPTTQFQAVPEPQPGVFSAAECWTPVPSQLQDKVACGYVIVPERHANPGGEKIRLAVMIIRSQGADHQPDALFIAQGGPGGSTIDTYAEVMLTFKSLVSNRDVVLFDQRGTLYSEPALMCAEYDQLLLDTIEKDLEPEAYYQLELAASTACRERLLKQGIDLDAYNSLENAADIQALRQALGYEQINLYGVSYGTLLALHAMRFYPQNLRSVILDSVVPPQTNFITQVPQTAQRAFNLLFETCALNPSCSQAYPDLEQEFYQLVDDLNQNPVSVPMTDPDSGITYQALIDGDTFLDSIFQLMYATELIPAIPMTIMDATQGNYDFFARIMSIFIFDRSFSYGMYYTILCSEDADFDPQEISLEGVQDQVAAAEKDGPSQFLKTCERWQVDALNYPMDDPVSSQVPVLLLTGNFDPITPPSYARTVAESLPNSILVEIPTGGHGLALSGDCQDDIIRSFLDHPDQAADLSCVTPLEDMEFFTPGNIIQLPAIIQVLNLQDERVLEFIFLSGAGLILLPVILIAPFRYLARKSRRTKREQLTTQLSDDIHLANNLPLETTVVDSQEIPGTKESWIKCLLAAPDWLLWFYTSVSWVFLVSLFSIVGNMLFGNDNRLFFGLSSQVKPLFILPWIMILIVFLYGFAFLRYWRKPGARLFPKLLYGLGLLATIEILVILGRWGIFSAIL